MQKVLPPPTNVPIMIFTAAPYRKDNLKSCRQCAICKVTLVEEVLTEDTHFTLN